MRVVVAVCCNEQGEVLLAQRAATAHLGGTWEFPGGKVETGESDADALQRELREELGLEIALTKPAESAAWSPLLTRQFDYPDRSLLIQAYLLHLNAAQCAQIQGREAQLLRWLPPDAISRLPTPAANAPLIAALCWPACWHITPDLAAPNATDVASTDDVASADPAEQAVLAWLFERCALNAMAPCLPRGSPPHGLVLRLPQWSLAAYRAMAEKALALTQAAGVPLLLHGDVRACHAIAAFGFHASSKQAAQWQQQGLSKAEILPAGFCLAVASHTADELMSAQAIGADWAWLSPVLPTPSHPERDGLGWAAWAALVQKVKLPVYALGGVRPSLLAQARAQGGVGVAGISGF